MKNRYSPRDISAISGPITAKNRRNAGNHPAIELGLCTPSQMISHTGIDVTGNICIVGNHSRGLSVLTPLIRRSGKPFLIIGPEAGRSEPFMSLEPDWTINAPQKELPGGNGAILLSNPYSSYIGMCEHFNNWSKDYFIILYLSGGVQAGFELLNLINAAEQCAIFCDTIPQAIRNSEAKTITVKEFLSSMSYLLVYSAGIATKELIEILPTYQYEKVSNTMTFNGHTGRAFFHPMRGHKGFGASVGQTRTMEYNKSLYEMQELQRIFSEGTALIYNAITNMVYLAQVT